MAVEDQHLDVLQNIEFAIMQVYESTPDLIDTEVFKAIEAVTRTYSAEAQGRSGSAPNVRGVSAEVAEQVREACEMRLGRATVNAIDESMEPKTLTDIVDCLKRIQSSIKFWTQKGGRQGYLNFVKNFFQPQ
jgi:predicted cobalt transporter CbtA